MKSSVNDDFISQQRLYNLTYEGKQYVSTIEPIKLPEDNYSFVEISYDEKLVTSVKAVYVIDGKKEDIILSDLDFLHYLRDLEGNINDVEFVGVVEQPKNKNELFLIINVCSYLVYFHFMKFDYELSLDLLDTKAIEYFISEKFTDVIQEAWKTQVSDFYKKYHYLFPSLYKIEDITSSNDNISQKERKEETKSRNKNHKKEKREIVNKSVYKDNIKKYTKKKLAEIDVVIEKATELAIQRINKEVEELIKEVKEFKKKMLIDISK